MEIVKETLENQKNQYITFTEHKGEDFHLIENIYLQGKWRKSF